MMRRKSLLAFAAGGTLALTLAACGTSASPSPGGAAGAPIVLGASLPLTGQLGGFGPLIRAGYEQGVAAINAAGGVNVGGTKHQLKLVVRDNKSDPQQVTALSKSLINDDGAVVLLGSVTPPLNIPLSVVADQEQVPAVMSLTPTLAWMGANKGGWKYAYDVFVDEKQQTAVNFQASGLTTTNKKVALFTDTEEDGKAMGALWESEAPKYGYTIAYRAQFPVGTTDFSQFIQKAKDSGADVMIAQVIPPDAVALWKQMKALKYSPKVAFPEKGGAFGFDQALGDVAEGACVFGWWSSTNGNVDGQAVYDTAKAKYGDGLGAQGIVATYAVVQIVADALSRAGSTDPTAVNKALSQTKDLATVLAKITFGPDHRSVLQATMTQWQRAAQLTVWPAGQATAKLVAPVPGLVI
jgi:branched-chain amino acid transport system substrate-binding protein